MMLELTLGAFGVLAALLAAVNTVQVLLGRQLVKPSASKRPTSQLRAESAAAAVAMLGVSAAAFGILAGGLWPIPGGTLMLFGWIALRVTRRHSTLRPSPEL